MKTSFLPAGVALATCAAGLLIPFGVRDGGAADGHRRATPRAHPQRRARGVAGREVLDQAARHRSARSRGSRPRRGRGPDPGGRHRAPVARPRRRRRAATTARTTRCAASATTSRSGSPTTSPFPAGDCRSAAEHRRSPSAQVDRLVNEFDTNMYPKETAAFSTPPDRDGSGASWTRRQRQRRRLHRRRRQDRHAGRQRPRRQLLRLPGGARRTSRASSRRSSTSCSTAT